MFRFCCFMLLSFYLKELFCLAIQLLLYVIVQELYFVKLHDGIDQNFRGDDKFCQRKIKSY